MAHNLYLGMYTFSIKRKRTRSSVIIDNNEFLELAYPAIDGNKFALGFCQDVISLLDEKAYKNAQNTHGAILDQYNINEKNRVLDILIDGGLTGIKQFLIEEDGEKSEVSADDIVGPKFYARFWLPAGTKTGYVFIHKYGGMSIKPIYDSIIKDLLGKYDLSIAKSKLKASTTKKRLKEFLERAALKDVTIISSSGANSTGAAEASSVEVRLKNYRTLKKNKKSYDLDNLKEALKQHGFSIGKKRYEIKGVFEYKHDGIREERTIQLDASEETINIVPNVVVPSSCIDDNNYPIFDEIVKLTDKEIDQVLKESKK